MIALARHARPDGRPRRVWTPAPAPAPAALPTLALPVVVLDAAQTLVLRGRIARAQWDFFVATYGVIAAYDRTTPGHWRRQVRRFGRHATAFLRGLWKAVFNTVFVIAAVGVTAHLAGPVAYEVGL